MRLTALGSSALAVVVGIATVGRGPAAAAPPSWTPVAPCRVTGALGHQPALGTRGIEPSPFRYRGVISFAAAPEVRIFALEFVVHASNGSCRVTEPVPAFPWKGATTRQLGVECTSTTALANTQGVARVATSAEQAKPTFSPAKPLTPCAGGFGFER